MEMEDASADSVPEFPNDLIIEILTYLPAKSLLKFRCVCKSWFSLISSHQFAKSHLLKSKHHSSFSPHRIMLHSRGNMKHCSLQSILHDPVIDAVITDYPLRGTEKLVWVVGSCDGLICLVINKQKLMLWNPTTRNCKELPDMGVETKDATYVTYGLGFDKTNDDYKVAAFSTWKGKGKGKGKGDLGEAEVIVKVYSVKSDEWKRLKNYKGHELMSDTAAFAHGKLHWISSWEEWGWEIVSLDLESEEYGVVQLPSYDSSVDYCRLGEWEGRQVYLLCSHGMSGDVWIMEDDGRSWLKVATIPYNDDCIRYTFKKVLYVAVEEGLGGGEVVLHCGDKFVVFDSKDEFFRYPQVRNLNKFAAPAAYIESLVSPNRGCVVQVDG